MEIFSKGSPQRCEWQGGISLTRNNGHVTPNDFVDQEFMTAKKFEKGGSYLLSFTYRTLPYVKVG